MELKDANCEDVQANLTYISLTQLPFAISITRLAEQAQKMLERGIRFENVCLGERRPASLIRRYGNLYAQV